MDDDETVKILGKHILKFFKLSPVYFAEGADREKLAYWLANKCVEEGWIKVAPEIVKETLHPLTMDARYLGGKVEHEKTINVLPKGSKVAILKKGERVL